MNQIIPWVEKYRPNSFENIILDTNNEQIINSILETNDFPHLLLFGPPGTGKTTTITNLIDAYQEQNGEKHKELIIHLNASDDRGIDIIRNQIMLFINSKHLFNKGLKFVILDEVDYMTKTAQLALKYLLENNNENVRFCLICNYITKIEKTLQHEFVRLKFNKLPRKDISNYLQKIIKRENLDFSAVYINNIIDFYDSDIRSMINTIQNNAYTNNTKHNCSREEIYENLLAIIKNNTAAHFDKKCNNYLQNYSIEKKEFFLNFFYFIIERIGNTQIERFLNFYETIFKTNIYSLKFNAYFYKNIKTYINENN